MLSLQTPAALQILLLGAPMQMMWMQAQLVVAQMHDNILVPIIARGWSIQCPTHHPVCIHTTASRESAVRAQLDVLLLQQPQHVLLSDPKCMLELAWIVELDVQTLDSC
jgi:hypothetical protein